MISFHANFAVRQVRVGLCLRTIPFLQIELTRESLANEAVGIHLIEALDVALDLASRGIHIDLLSYVLLLLSILG